MCRKTWDTVRMKFVSLQIPRLIRHNNQLLVQDQQDYGRYKAFHMSISSPESHGDLYN